MPSPTPPVPPAISPEGVSATGTPSRPDARLVPYDRSARWQLSADYFANRGLGAWLDGEVPCEATNNYPFARQHAAVFLALAQSLDPPGSSSRGEAPEGGKAERIEILELAGGPGEFATNFLAALREDFGDAGRALYERTTYYFSDFARTSITEVIQRPAMAALIAEGRIVPALCDAMAPAGIRSLDGDGDGDGRPLSIAPLLILGNYLCCVLPHKVLRKRGTAWSELYASREPRFPSAQGEEDDDKKDSYADWAELLGEHAWRPVSLPELLGAPEPVQALLYATRDSQRAEVAYPLGFVETLARAAELLRPGGAMMFSDFPDQYSEERLDDLTKTPVLYGQSLAHAVCFPLLATLLERMGAEFLDNPATERSTRTILIGPGTPLSAQTRAAYKERFVLTHGGSDYLDFLSVAQDAASQGDHRRAIRFYRRCIDLDPHNPEHYKSCGTSCFSDGQYLAALRQFMRGATLMGAASCDFELHIGEAHYRLGNHEQAIAHVEASLREAAAPIKYVALADIHRARKEYARALSALQGALRLSPGFSPALQRLAELKAAWAEEELHLSTTMERWWGAKTRT